MAQFLIRQYEDKDFEAVRDMFARGILEHVPSVYRHVLTWRRAQLALLALVVTAWVATGAWTAVLAAAALPLLVLWPLARSLGTSYVRDALATDLQDIAGTYLRAPDSGFWVAEAGGAVVGMVAAVPAPEPAALELKRMSVAREQRGRGVAQALARRVLALARARGHRAVVLSTSVVQAPARRLYERLGFRVCGASSPSPLARLLRFQVLHYRCELPPPSPAASPGLRRRDAPAAAP
ncbi:N-acetyltransferase 8 [Eudromia elegans]